MPLVLAAALTHGPGQLADFLGQPRNGCGRASRPVALAVRCRHQLLEVAQVHGQPLTIDSAFANRTDAGRELAAQLARVPAVAAAAIDGSLVVLGLPRGGVPIARVVADALDAPLDVFVVRKLGAPMQPELAVGAVASGGTRVLNDDLVRLIGLDAHDLDRLTERELRVVNERDHAYRGSRQPLDVAGRTVVVVDDGLATGATMRAALAALRSLGAATLIVGVPVAAPESVRAALDIADDVIAVLTPDDFVAVGAWYRDFHQVSDREVRKALDA